MRYSLEQCINILKDVTPPGDECLHSDYYTSLCALAKATALNLKLKDTHSNPNFDACQDCPIVTHVKEFYEKGRDLIDQDVSTTYIPPNH